MIADELSAHIRRTTVVSSDGVELAVTEVEGPRTARTARTASVTTPPDAAARRPVVVAHGAGSSARFVVEAFAVPLWETGHRLVTYDLRGHGDSTPVPDPGRHTLDHHAADLAAVAERSGADVVGGVSLGAHAAATYAVQEDVTGLLLCMPAWTGHATPGEGPHAVVADQVRSLGVEEVLRRAVVDTPAWLGGLLARDWSRCDPDSLAAALLALDGGDAPDLADLRSIEAPAGVVGWPHDPGHPLAVAEQWADALRQAVLVRTTLDEVGRDREALGRSAVAAWQRAAGS